MTARYKTVDGGSSESHINTSPPNAFASAGKGAIRVLSGAIKHRDDWHLRAGTFQTGTAVCSGVEMMTTQRQSHRDAVPEGDVPARTADVMVACIHGAQTSRHNDTRW